jgi:hypothetical protein
MKKSPTRSLASIAIVSQKKASVTETKLGDGWQQQQIAQLPVVGRVLCKERGKASLLRARQEVVDSHLCNDETAATAITVGKVMMSTRVEQQQEKTITELIVIDLLLEVILTPVDMEETEIDEGKSVAQVMIEKSTHVINCNDNALATLQQQAEKTSTKSILSGGIVTCKSREWERKSCRLSIKPSVEPSSPASVTTTAADGVVVTPSPPRLGLISRARLTPRVLLSPNILFSLTKVVWRLSKGTR